MRIKDITTDHLGQVATDEDVRAFQETCWRIRPAFNTDDYPEIDCGADVGSGQRVECIVTLDDEAEGQYLNGYIRRCDRKGRPTLVKSSRTGRLWHLTWWGAHADECDAMLLADVRRNRKKARDEDEIE